MSSSLSATSIQPSALPKKLPIFPLSGAVLLPRARLPLNVFEPRYLAMIEDVLGTPGRMVGMVQPQVHESQSNRPPLYKIGCAGRLVSFDETDDGRFLIALVGVSRFMLVNELADRQPYRMAEVNWEPFAADLEGPQTAADIGREKLLSVLQGYFKHQQIDADWTAVENTPDEILVSSLIMACPLPVNEKQALLEAGDLAARAEMLATILQMAGHPSSDEDATPH